MVTNIAKIPIRIGKIAAINLLLLFSTASVFRIPYHRGPLDDPGTVLGVPLFLLIVFKQFECKLVVLSGMWNVNLPHVKNSNS